MPSNLEIHERYILFIL